ncbi:MAG TPA: M28 family peptidase [Verrucomicrobiae bacterium]|nr:M28 family peptidase [Verrucomicrobiae bacterium]
MAARLNALVVAIALLASCSAKSPREIAWRTFDGQRAFADVERLVSYGPRPTGSPALAQAATHITTQLRESGLDAEEQVFVAPTPRGLLQFRNIVGKTRGGHGGDGSVIIIGTHYDTKWFTNMTFVGANDGGSSAGVALEMARVASGTPNLWFVFFDGEECVNRYGPEDGLQGSKFFVDSLKDAGQVNQIKAMILLDMVGDANLTVTIPANSTGTLTERLFQAARDAGDRDYFGLAETETLDDHVPFLNAGISAIDIIDFEFGSAPGRNDYWHTDRDTLDKISPRSLTIVGQTALRLVSLLQNQPAAR